MSDIKIVEVKNIWQLKQFASLPRRIYKPAVAFAPQLVLERMLHFSRFNPYFQHAQACYFLAYKNGKPVGRISAQICQSFLQHYDDKRGHFGFVDAIDDAQVFARLFEACEKWLKERKMESMEGPYSFGINDECGVLVTGQQNKQCLLYPYHPSYTHTHIESLGFGKAKDLMGFDFTPERYHLSPSFPKFMKVVDRHIERGFDGKAAQVKILSSTEIESYMSKVTDFYNESWQVNWRALPLSLDEAGRFKRLIKLIKRRCFLISVENSEAEMLGFMLVVPSINDWLTGLNGRVFPIGWLVLIYRLFFSRPVYYRGLIAGVKPMFHKTIHSGIIFSAMLKHLYFSDAIKNLPNNPELSKKSTFNAGWILEDNTGMLRIVDYFNGQQRHLYRIYEKDIA